MALICSYSSEACSCSHNSNPLACMALAVNLKSMADNFPTVEKRYISSIEILHTDSSEDVTENVSTPFELDSSQRVSAPGKRPPSTSSYSASILWNQTIFLLTGLITTLMTQWLHYRGAAGELFVTRLKSSLSRIYLPSQCDGGQ